MSDKLKQILDRQDRAWCATQNIRERASDDLMFSRVTQWDDSMDWCALEYRGEFNLIWKERQRLLSEMRANDMSATFSPNDDADPDAGALLEGMYRADMRNNRSKEAIDVAVGDMIDAGYGAWRLVTEYVAGENDLDNRQVIRRVPIHEANNTVFFDPDAKDYDKADARWVTIIHQMSKDALDELCEEYGIDDDAKIANFSHTATSYVFPWGNSEKTYSIGEYYERTKKTERIVIMEHPAFGVKAFKLKEIKKIKEEMAAIGWVEVGKKTRDFYEVNKYLVSGSNIIHGPERIAGEYLPVIPCYGNWYFVEAVECWSGITRLAKDPQRLYNMQMSYLADIAAKGPRNKPILFAEQVQGYQHIWDNSSDYRYLLVNRKSQNGEDLPAGPIAYEQPEQIPQATIAMLEATRRGVEDVTSPGMPQDVLNPDASGKAIMAVQSRIDNQSFLYIDNLAKSQRHDAVVYASMAREIYDTTREVTVADYQGKERRETLMDSVQDLATGEWITLNDISRGRFDVYIDIGPAWQSQRDKARAELREMMSGTQNPELQSILQFQYLAMLEGPDMKALRKYAHQNLLKAGVIEPTSEEDMAYVQSLQNQPPDPQQEAVTQALQAQAIKDQSQAEQARANSIKALADAEKSRAQTAETLANVDAKSLANAEQLAQALRGSIRQSLTLQ